MFVLDRSYRRFGPVVLGGSPLRLFRLGRAGVGVVEAIERGEDPPAGHRRLTDRLVDAGAVHPLPVGGRFTPADVTVVVPAFRAAPPAGLTGLTGLIVVDDASDPPLAEVTGARVLRLAANSGPGAARNRGLAEVRTPLVAFVDTDVTPSAGWLDPLLAHFADPRVALAAPRVASTPGHGLIAVYEQTRSPLDLGDATARISPGTRVSYVPAAAIVCRTDALEAIGGFAEELRFGEDVDLVWRLNEAGWRCRYEPSSLVHHAPRPTAWAWARQRFAYGRSAAPLATRHPGALAPLRMSGWSAAVWLALAARRPLLAGGVAAGTSVALARKLGDLPPAEPWRVVLTGHALAGRQVASAITRAWLPLSLAALSWRPARTPVALAALVPPLLDWVSGGTRLDPLRYTALRLADDAAYSAGLWSGAVRARSAAALRPSFTSWPGRRA